MECPYCNYEYDYVDYKNDMEVYQCKHCLYECDWNGRNILNKRKINKG